MCNLSSGGAWDWGWSSYMTNDKASQSASFRKATHLITLSAYSGVKTAYISGVKFSHIGLYSAS